MLSNAGLQGFAQLLKSSSRVQNLRNVFNQFYKGACVRLSMLPCDKIICLFFPQRSFLKHTKHDFMKQQICFLTLKEVSMGAYSHWQMRRLGLWTLTNPGMYKKFNVTNSETFSGKVCECLNMSRKWEQTTRKKNQSQDFFFSMTSKSYSFLLHGFSNLAAFPFFLVHLRMIYEISEVWLKMKCLLGN